MDPRALQDEELKARHRITTVTGTSGAAIAYDYKPCQPITMREVAIGGRRDCRCLARKDNFLFVGVHGGGLAVVDIADPRTSPIIHLLAMPGCELVDFTLAGDTLYAADFLNGVHAIDVSDPKLPRHIAMHPALTHANNRRVVTNGDVLVLVNDHAISVFDVSAKQLRPLALQHRLRTGVGWLRGVVLADKRLYVTQGPMGLWTFDLSDLAKPRIVDGQELRLDTRADQRLIIDSLAQLGPRLVAGTSSGIWSLKLTDAAPESEAFFTGPGTVREARSQARDGQLYFAALEPHDHILHIFDVAEGVRYMGRQRLSRVIERIYDLELGDGYWIGAAGNAGILFASY
ncbi:MAG: hypothetical protein M4D80_14220 [Myxococcota bacterium]|nr:hypothetical protein [Myxococcota bacterium]